MAKTEHTIPPELTSMAIHAIRRAGHGEIVDVTHWGRHDSGSSIKALDALLAGSFMELHETPKNRKRTLALTDKGRALVPLIREQDKRAKAEQQAATEAWGRAERIRAAGPALLKALDALVRDWDSLDPDTRVPDAINVNEHWNAARAAIARAKGD